MTLRVVHVNCVVDGSRRAPDALLDSWHTLPAIAEATARAGADVRVVQASWTSAEHHRRGVIYRFVKEPRLRRSHGSGLMPWWLARSIAQEHADVVHFNGLDFPAHARTVSSLGIPMLVQDHASRADARIGRLRRWGHAKVAAAAFTAAAQANPFLAARQLPRSIRLFAIPESSSGFTPGDREEARARTGISGDPALLWIGRLDANKDPLTILDALSRSRHALPDAHLWCAYGDDALLPVMTRRLNADPDLARRVHLLGRLPHDEIEWLCRACDLYVSASRQEGSGYALIEAMACGLVPVVSDITPFRALTLDGSVGELTPPGDAAAMADAILAAARQPRDAARDAVIRHFKRHLSFDVIGARLVEAYDIIAREARR